MPLLRVTYGKFNGIRTSASRSRYTRYVLPYLLPCAKYMFIWK